MQNFPSNKKIFDRIVFHSIQGITYNKPIIDNESKMIDTCIKNTYQKIYLDLICYANLRLSVL